MFFLMTQFFKRKIPCLHHDKSKEDQELRKCYDDILPQQLN